MRQTIEIVLNHQVVKRLHLADFLWSSSYWSGDDDFFTLMVKQIFSHCWWDSKEASSWETIGYRPLVFHIGYLRMLVYSDKSPQALTLNLFSFKSFATSVMKRRQVWNKARHGNWLRFVHHAIKFARERGWLPQKLPCADSLVVDDHPCRLFMFMTRDVTGVPSCCILTTMSFYTQRLGGEILDGHVTLLEILAKSSPRHKDDQSLAHSPARAACLSSFGRKDSHMLCLSGYIVWSLLVICARWKCHVSVYFLSATVFMNSASHNFLLHLWTWQGEGDIPALFEKHLKSSKRRMFCFPHVIAFE